MRRTVGSTLGAILVAAFASGGCGGDNPAQPQSGDPAGTGAYSPDPNAAPALSFVADASQTLQFGQTADLSVRYFDLNTGEGISSAPISYTLVGDTGGAELGALQAVTDDSGEARMTLTAGQSNASFVVEVTPPANRGAPISFQIVVSDQPVGAVTVGMTYLGDLPLQNLEPQLHRGVACGTLDPNALPPPLEALDAPLGSVQDTTGWEGLEVGADYAVVVTGQVGPNVRAFGCVDNVEVRQSETTDLRVALADLDWPGPVLGTYQLVNHFDFGGHLPGSVEVSIDLVAELTDDQDIDCNLGTQDYGQDPGAFLTDFAMRQTCRWECAPGQDFDTCTEQDHGYGDIGALCEQNMMLWEGGQSKFFGGCGAWEVGAPYLQQQVNAYVAQHVPGGVLALSEMAGDLARAINQAKIYSELSVQQGSDTSQPMTHRLVEMEVLLHDLQGNEHTYRFDLAEAGFTSLQTNAALSVVDDHVTIPEHAFQISYGKLVQHIYLNGLLPLFGYGSTTEMFSSWVDCAAVGQYIAANVQWVPISAQGWQGFCEMGVQVAGETFDTQLTGAVDHEGALALQGTATAAEIDLVSNLAATLTGGQWTGSWSEQAEGGEVSGSFTGARVQ